jgi:chloride channel 7
MGSGVAEVIGYINGVNYPKCINFNTLVTKIIGVVLAVAGGLAVGKEGPLGHIGANLGAAVVNIPGFKFL